MRRAFRWLIVGVLLAGLAALGSALLARWLDPDLPYSRDHQELLAALGPARPIPARLSGGSPYHPYRPIPTSVSPGQAGNAPDATRGGNKKTESASGNPLPPEVARSIRRSGEGKAAPEDQAALAALNLLDGDTARAIQLLQDAHDQAPDDPRILNDLSAALLTVHEATGDPWSAVEALEKALQAERLEPTLPVLFNKALALERLGARTRAIVAWEQYLQEDRRSDWAREAGQRLDRLEREAREIPKLLTVPAADVAAFEGNPWANRQLAERTLLPRWGEHTLAGRTAEAEVALALAEALTATLTPEGGRLLNASTSEIREAQRTGDRQRLDRLAHGYQGFGQAFVQRRSEQTTKAREILEDAIRDFQAAGSPFELRARLLRAWMAEPPDWRELRLLQQTGFASITAEARRLAAYRIMLEGRLESSLRAYRDARRQFEALREREESAAVAALIAEALWMLSREPETAMDLNRALGAGLRVADPYSRYSIYLLVASTVRKYPRAAVELRLEAADACQDMPERPLCAVDSALRVAALTPDSDTAERALQRADELLAKTPDSDGRKRTEIDLTEARARWLAGDGRPPTDREKAASLYGETTAAYQARGLALSTARSRAKRADILQQLGLTKQAAAEYRASLQSFRQWDERDRFKPEQAEKGSPRELREVYEALLGIELDFAAPRPSVAAFLLSEEMRDRLAPRRTAGLWLPKLADVQRFLTAVPPGTAVIEYAIAGERTVAWILAGGRLDQVILDPGEDLGDRISSLADHRQKRDLDGWKRTSGAIYQDLLAPVLNRLPSGTKRLVLVPDSKLYSLPFRSLWDPASARYLDETFTIVLAPSARQILGPEAPRGSSPAVAEFPVLSLGFNSFPPDLDLDRLPLAEKEAEAVRTIHGRGECKATDWAGFRDCAPRAAVIHLATHASADSTGSGRTWLALEQETVSLDRLWKELPNLPLRPLVVLSACQSVASAGGGEGLGGLARPFLAGGARAVVGTLWKIRDEDAAEIFPAFHRAYRDSGDAAEALKEAREELEGWQERPWAWGGVEVLERGLLQDQ